MIHRVTRILRHNLGSQPFLVLAGGEESPEQHPSDGEEDRRYASGNQRDGRQVQRPAEERQIGVGQVM